MKKMLCFALAALMLFALCSCGKNEEPKTEDKTEKTQKYADAVTITLGEAEASVNGKAVSEYDYTWHADPGKVHEEVKDAPAEYYTGSLPEETEDIYIDRELYYYPELDESLFRLVNYDGEQEWAYYYTDGVNDEYIFATLPHFGSSVPADMMHSEEEALKNKVLHITKAGTYVLTGSWNGQIKIDLGEDAFGDSSRKVTLILDGADINCTVAPGILFGNLYECDGKWEERDSRSAVSDIGDAGANVIIADGSENTVSGQNVFRMLKTKYKDENSADAENGAVKTQKKMRKTDAAFYSCVSMNISGESDGSGSLTINSGFEGLDSELHLAINSGKITVNSQDDGINVNEDNVSTFIMNGGTLTLNAGKGFEGDGVDSNGFVLLNGGTLAVNNVTAPDNSVDSEDGITYNGGKIVIDNNEMSFTAGQKMREISSAAQGMDRGGERPGNPGENGAPEPPGGFGQERDGMTPPGGRMQDDFDIKKFKEEVNKLPDDAELDDVLRLIGWNKPEDER